MKRIIPINVIRIIGRIWLPPVVCAQTLHPSSYDINNMRDDEGKITRDSVEQWLGTHAGDFQSIIDFSVSLDEELESDWAKGEDSDMTYGDCMCPDDDRYQT